MSKFLSGRQSNLKLGVAGYTENKTVLETTGKVGIGTTDAQGFSLYVVGPTNITGITTFTSGLNLPDNKIATFGDDEDLKIYHDSSGQSYIKDVGTGDLNLTSDGSGIHLQSGSGETLARFYTDGASLLYYDGQQKLSTSGIGVTVTGRVDADSAVISGNLDVDGTTELDGLNVDGSTTLDATTVDGLLDINAGGQANTFKVEDLTDNRIVLAGSGGELEDSSNLTFDGATLDVTGHTELDQLRVAGVSTFAGNVDISSNGNLTVAGNLIVQGTETRLNTTALEVEDINIGIASATPKLSNASLDGAGITIYGSAGDKTLTWSNANSRMEFNTDVNVANLRLDDNQKATFGTGNDLQIDHNGSVSRIIDTSGTLVYRSGIHRIKNQAGIEELATFTENGSVELYYDNLKKFETTDGGIDVTGHTETDTLRVSGVSTFQGNVHLGDNDQLRLGDSADLLLYHNGVNSFILDQGAGNLVLGTDGQKIRFAKGSGAESLAEFYIDGAVELYYDNSKKFETTSYGVKIYDDLNVGTGVTIYGNAGIVSATSFFGDGSNLTNTGATLSATSGVERLVTTQLTSGTMVDAATDADLTFDAGTNTLNTQNIKISGGISTDGSDYGQQFQLLRAQGNGKWEWATVPGIFSVNNILNGFNVLEEGGTVGTAGSIHTLDFRGINVTASADPQPNGIATITFSSTPTFDSVTVNDFIDLNGDLEVLGVSTFSSNVHVGSGITMYAATGIVSATKLYGDGSDLTGINAGAILGISSGTQRLVMTGLTSGAMLNAATDADLRYNSVTDTLITENLNVVGLSTFVGVGTFYDDLYVYGNLNVTGDILYDEISGRNLNISGIATFGGPISVGGSTGTNGQYLKSTGVGVTWADFPTLRTTHTESANAGVTTFNFTYNVNFLDVFINGVKLTPTEYTASNGSAVTLATPTFQDDIVELVSYNTVSTGAGAGSSTGVSDGDKGDIIVSGSGTNWQIDANTIGPNELINTSVTPGTYNFATLTVDADGRLTAASTGTPPAETFTAVGIQSGGSLVGSAQTINFANNLTATVSNGVATIDSLGGGGGGASVEVSDTAPSNPSEGDLWWRSTDGKGFIYYNDGNSNQWVEFNPSAVGIAGISTTGTSTFNVISANTYQGITTSMISDYGNGLSSGGGSNVSISTEAPSNPASGDLWWDSDVAKGYIYYTDGSSNQWVEFNPAGGGSGGGSGGSGGGSGITTANINADTLNVSGVSTLGVTTVTQFESVGYSTFKGRVVFDEILEFRGLEIGGANTLDFYDSSSVLRHSIGYDGTHFTVGGGDSVKIDSSASGDVEISRGGTGIATFTGSGLNVSGIVTASSFVGDGSNLTGIGTVAISDNAPSSPDVGQLWWESDTATGHIYYNDGSTSQWVQFNSGSSSSSSGVGTSRFTVSNTTGSIGAGTTADITISGAKAYSLFKIDTSHAAWVRLYTDTTSRTNDASRAYTTDPTPGSGVLAEVYTTTSGSNTFKMTPAVTGWNDDATPSTNIYAKVTNNESTSQDITVTLTILRMED